MTLLEMFTYPFIVRAFAAGVLLSLCAALLGVPLVLKRYSMIGDGLSHVSFGALSVALACARQGIACVEVRSVSNRVGPRAPHETDFPGAMRRLADIWRPAP